MSVTITATGDVLYFKPDDTGKFRFELPPGATAGTTILVRDEDDPSRTAAILVSPAP